MIINWIYILTLISLISCNMSETEKEDSFPILSGKYMGQEEPNLQPEIFAPNIVSTGMTEINACFSPDYKEFFYSIILPNGQFVIMSMSYINNKWTEPEVADFSGEYSEADPFITSDGKWLYYVSKKPVDSTKIIKADWDIWRLEKINGVWSNPERLGSEINSDADDIYPTLTRNGTLYFSSGRIGENNRDIYYAKSSGKEFEHSVRLSDTINSRWEGDIYISPEEDYMIFRSFGRKEGSGLYISFKKKGQWNLPIRMSKEINMTGRELCPIVSPDGKFFFFTSNNTINEAETTEKLSYHKIKEDFIKSYKYPAMGKNDIYWVNIKTIEKYRKAENE